MASVKKLEEIPIEVPDWVKAELFVDVLKQTVKGFSEINSFKVNSGIPKGENYNSLMLRLDIHVELNDGMDKTISFMLKVPIKRKQKNMFNEERGAYKETIPEMEQMYRDAGVEVKFAAQAYEVKGAKTEYILLEDLTPKGFKNSNRLEGLDQNHTECALRKLSQWHAASAVRVATKGPFPDYYGTPCSNPEDSDTRKVRSDHPIIEGNEYYIDQKAIREDFLDTVNIMFKIDPNEFNALNHGDFWSNNIMYSYDSLGKIKEIYFLDFQTPYYSSVALDLYYFLMSSTTLDDKIVKFDYYIKFYHENLAQNLKLLKYPKNIPTLRDIHMSIFKNGLWAFKTVATIMNTALLDYTELASADNDSSDSQDLKMLFYSNPRYRKHIQVVMPWLMNRGALEL